MYAFYFFLSIFYLLLFFCCHVLFLLSCFVLLIIYFVALSSFALLSLPCFAISFFCSFNLMFCPLLTLFCFCYLFYLLAIFAFFFRAPLRVGVSRFFAALIFWVVFHLLYLCKEHYTNSTCFIYGRFHVSHALRSPLAGSRFTSSYGI